MSSLTVPVTEEGIVIPKLAARLLGARAGDWAQVDVTVLPSSEELKDKALHYALHRLGDAVYTGEPAWADDGWCLPIRVRGHEGTFGQVFLSPEGQVIEARTTSHMELLEALNAGSTAPSPAG